MIENFIEYMWYLLTTPLKKLKRSLNKWYILCRVFGRRFDEVKEDILRARDEGMVATCSHEMLPVHGADRRLTRYEGEHPENYRSRIAMYEEVCKLGGTNEGIRLAVKALGFKAVEIRTVKEIYGSMDRWAEFCVILPMDMEAVYPISLKILKKEVRKVKEVGARDNYLVRIQGAIYSKGHLCLIRGIIYLRFRWYTNTIWNGESLWDGGHAWGSTQNNHPMHINIKMQMPMQPAHLAGFIRRYHYWTWNGSGTWEGTKNWDAEITKEVL